MASIGHIAVGMAAARIDRAGRTPRWSWLAACAAWSALSLVPDADTIGFALGVRYEDEWGHRGAMHSVAFSISLALLVGLVTRLVGLPAKRTTILATVVLTSHAFLDTLTDGGLGCALWWPFDLTRHFAPWNPIPVAPIGLYFFSPYGLLVAMTEVVLFAPAWAFAIWPQHIRRSATAVAAICLWLGSVWLLRRPG